jgi:hypothetical protein
MNNNEKELFKCCQCLTDVEERDLAKIPCNTLHGLHATCLVEWFVQCHNEKRSLRCPVCSKVFGPEQRPVDIFAGFREMMDRPEYPRQLISREFQIAVVIMIIVTTILVIIIAPLQIMAFFLKCTI